MFVVLRGTKYSGQTRQQQGCRGRSSQRSLDTAAKEKAQTSEPLGHSPLCMDLDMKSSTAQSSLREQHQASESSPATQGEDKDPAPKGCGAWSFLSERELCSLPAGDQEAVIGPCIPGTKTWLWEDGASHRENWLAHGGRASQPSGQVLATPQCLREAAGQGSSQPRSPDVGAPLAAHHAQVLFDHQVVVSRGFRPARGLKAELHHKGLFAHQFWEGRRRSEPTVPPHPPTGIPPHPGR